MCCDEESSLLQTLQVDGTLPCLQGPTEPDGNEHGMNMALSKRLARLKSCRMYNVLKETASHCGTGPDCRLPYRFGVRQREPQSLRAPAKAMGCKP